MIPEVATACLARVHADVAALFDPDNGLLPDGTPYPRVTLDMPRGEMEPLHVFTWGHTRDFEVEGFISGQVVRARFKVRVTAVATAPTTEDAAELASRYLDLLVQVTLCDTTLGGLAEEIGWPQVAEASAWVDDSGRCHSGYVVEYEISNLVAASPDAAAVLRGLDQ